MKTPLLLITVALGLATGCGKKTTQKPEENAAHPATAPLDYLAAQGKAKQLAIKVTSTAEINSAIQKFFAMEDRYPRDLNELVQQHYLQAVPQAPRGQVFSYQPQDGSIRVVAAPAAPSGPAR